ncbi:hypothetical protein [Arthrobacter sp. AFG7.2]|uniref:hypothetical protein n=1 Tax=Arthrobacter sp. AFG7.2 TaxID=1688693 RepID=UPI001CB8FBE8|nr:hypothetical protein [Arthrobacter sp. AFG7.2]
MNDAAMTVPGIQSTLINVNMNTSGNFITAKLVGNSMDQAELADALRRALPPMLEETSHLDGGTFSTSIFSPDDSVSVGASDFGYSGGASLERFREYFLD